MSHYQPALQIELLLQFGLQHHLIESLDVIPTRNSLLDLFQLTEPYEDDLSTEVDQSSSSTPGSPVDILEKLLDYAAEFELMEDNTLTHRDLMDARIMGLLMPRQSELVRSFWRTANTDSIQAATDAYYKLSIASNYIRMDRILKNQYWRTPTEFGELEITINLSKPEKDPKEIALLKNVKQSNYPACLLCVENVGYAGRLNHPARQNHRIIPFQLLDEQWNFQYSPYVYYNEHSIIFREEHIPMKMSSKTFKRLLQFTDQFPHYFIGSNADIPIVGGSILNHDHFQGGRHQFSMELAEVATQFSHRDYHNVKAAIIKWPMSVIRLGSTDQDELLQLASLVLSEWNEYSNPVVDILAYSDELGVRTPHNTITPIARRNQHGEYEMDLVLRNNRTCDEYPDGIFHPHQDLHHIKKENIGLIEVMGLAVLPGRLKTELEEIAAILTGTVSLTEALSNGTDSSLNKHASWINGMITAYGTSLTDEAATTVIEAEVGGKFLQVLMDAGVYKQDAPGQAAFRRFMGHLGFIIKE